MVARLRTEKQSSLSAASNSVEESIQNSIASTEILGRNAIERVFEWISQPRDYNAVTLTCTHWNNVIKKRHQWRLKMHHQIGVPLDKTFACGNPMAAYQHIVRYIELHKSRIGQSELSAFIYNTSFDARIAPERSPWFFYPYTKDVEQDFVHWLEMSDPDEKLHCLHQSILAGNERLVHYLIDRWDVTPDQMALYFAVATKQFDLVERCLILNPKSYWDMKICMQVARLSTNDAIRVLCLFQQHRFFSMDLSFFQTNPALFKFIIEDSTIPYSLMMEEDDTIAQSCFDILKRNHVVLPETVQIDPDGAEPSEDNTSDIERLYPNNHKVALNMFVADDSDNPVYAIIRKNNSKDYAAWLAKQDQPSSYVLSQHFSYAFNCGSINVIKFLFEQYGNEIMRDTDFFEELPDAASIMHLEFYQQVLELMASAFREVYSQRDGNEQDDAEEGSDDDTSFFEQEMASCMIITARSVGSTALFDYLLTHNNLYRSPYSFYGASSEGSAATIGSGPVYGYSMLLNNQGDIVRKIDAYLAVKRRYRYAVHYLRQLDDLNNVPELTMQSFLQWSIQLNDLETLKYILDNSQVVPNENAIRWVNWWRKDKTELQLMIENGEGVLPASEDSSLELSDDELVLNLRILGYAGQINVYDGSCIYWSSWDLETELAPYLVEKSKLST